MILGLNSIFSKCGMCRVFAQRVTILITVSYSYIYGYSMNNCKHVMSSQYVTLRTQGKEEEGEDHSPGDPHPGVNNEQVSL